MKFRVTTVAAITAVAAALFVASAAIASPITMAWSTVGNANNAPDPTTGFGSVGYDYRIGTYEVTNAQYAAFLNSVAATDPYNLYSMGMAVTPDGGIIRSGADGSYTYSVKPGMGAKPVNNVSWYDAARMCNWLTNGQGSGSTESGVYSFTSATSIIAITRDMSNPNQVFLPNEDEWYKAAYHQPFDQGGDADDYWLYPTSSNTIPTTVQANYGGVIGTTTPVGSYAPNFHGSFDMGGNVWEWTETLIGSIGVLRGSSFINSDASLLRSSFRNDINGADGTFFDSGFRLASPVPGPGSVALLAIGVVGALRRRRGAGR